jgi:hypothetical protein
MIFLIFLLTYCISNELMLLKGFLVLLILIDTLVTNKAKLKNIKLLASLIHTRFI